MFNSTRLTLEESEKIIVLAGANHSPVSGYLTQHALIVFAAELETELKAIVSDILTQKSDPFLAAFIMNTLASIIKRTKKKELTETIAYFGDDKKALFLASVSEEVLSRYQNYLVNRDNAAHGISINLTWSDIKQLADDGEAVLTAMKATILS